jgi:Patatin-like phospholipase
MTSTTNSAKEPRRAEPRKFPEVPSSLLAVLGQEFKELHHGAPVDDSSLLALYQSVHRLEAAGQEPRAALCLSGGGIRSAALGLGIIQGLARHGLLLKFHYLSTVSGGGYIGSWLTAWRRHAANDKAVLESLTSRRADPPDEPREIGSIRADSNYLTPRLGLLSADTWTAVSLYVRNLLLNWLVLVPMFAAGLLVPLVASRFLDWASCSPQAWRWVALALGLLLIGTGHTIAVASRPGEGRRGIDTAHFLLFVLLPTYGGATALAVFAAQGAGPLTGCSTVPLWPSADVWWAGAAAAAVVYAVSWLLGFAARRRMTLRAGMRPRSAADPLPPWARFCLWTLVGGLVGIYIWLGLHFWVGNPMPLVSQLWTTRPDLARDAIVVFGVSWIVLSLMVGEMLYIGLISYSRNGDADREWLARAAGWTVAVTLIWVCLSGLVLFGPLLVNRLVSWLVPLLGGVSGIVGALIGRSSKTAATSARDKGKGVSTAQIGRIAAVIFLLSLALLLSITLVPLLDFIGKALALEPNSPWCFIVAGCAVILLAGLSFLASYAINVNRFSLHAVYRNRLVRAFLGAARASQHRNPDAFTGFDLDDNIWMRKLWQPVEGIAPRLLHVVNMTLNVVHTTNLAWQQRKAETFTATPLATGNPYVGYRPTSAYGGARGLTLGTAMAISGAAASPNMGYHSSPLIGLMMTLFNVRLGWWFGNPSHRTTWKGEGPVFGISAIVQELLGLTDDASPYVYLSDGGHFENLGVYEMVRRRCRYVVVSDASSDPEGALGDLGNAIRKIWIDFGIRIVFPCFNIEPRTALSDGAPVSKQPRSEGGDEACYCAVGRIIYPEPDAAPGYLLYIKPTLYGNEPVDILSYAAESPTFPHESTADQWFSESQMESYRALGSYIVNRIWEREPPDPGAPGKVGLAHLVERACDHGRMTKLQKDELLSP